MNRYYYNFGNPFKVKLRKHYCYICGSKLSITEHRITIDKKSDEAKYYDFTIGVDGGVIIGPCQFIHNVFYCKQCQHNIEFITQTNQEDIDNIINGVQKRYNRSGKSIVIQKYFEITDGKIVEKSALEFVSCLYLLIKEEDRNQFVYRVPISRKNYWERPRYFKIRRRDLISFIKNVS